MCLILLFNMFALSLELPDKAEEGKKYKERLMDILKKNNLTDQKIYHMIV